MSFTFQFDNAIAAHKVWFRHLEFFLDGIEPDRVELDLIGDSDVCSLGQWLAGGGRKYAGLPGFTRLIEAHRLFHAVGARIVACIRENRIEAAQALLKDEMSDLSAEIVHLLEALKKDVHAAPQGAASAEPAHI
jgi:hypothetical protein